MVSDSNELSKLDFFCVVVLVILFFARLFLPETTFPVYIISIINFLGLTVALSSLVYTILYVVPGRFRSLVSTFLFIIIVVSALVVVFTIIKKYEYSNKINDCITIAALLVSVPSKFYITLVNKLC